MCCTFTRTCARGRKANRFQGQVKNIRRKLIVTCMETRKVVFPLIALETSKPSSGNDGWDATEKLGGMFD